MCCFRRTIEPRQGLRVSSPTRWLVQSVCSASAKLSSETVADKTKGTRQTGTQHNTTSQQHQTVFDQRATQLQYVSMVTFIIFARPASFAGGCETRFVASCRGINHPTQLFRATNSLATPPTTNHPKNAPKLAPAPRTCLPCCSTRSAV